MYSYKYVRAWCQFMGSFPYYITDQIDRAKEDNAPETAVYKNDNGWVTLDQIVDQCTRTTIEVMADEL